MKAEQIEFNGDWHKDCARCKKPYGAYTLLGLESFFPKDHRKPDGFAHTCKACKRVERKNNGSKELARWKRNYAPGTEQRKKHVIRSQTRRKYGSAKKHLCACGKQAAEWHHLEYATDKVVPLCEPCHSKL